MHYFFLNFPYLSCRKIRYAHRKTHRELKNIAIYPLVVKYENLRLEVSLTVAGVALAPSISRCAAVVRNSFSGRNRRNESSPVQGRSCDGVTKKEKAESSDSPYVFDAVRLLYGCGGSIYTSDLWVMRPLIYRNYHNYRNVQRNYHLQCNDQNFSQGEM
jgi:hypothetical protein